MPTKAFILIEAKVGMVQQVVRSLRALNGVATADVITGTYDMIVLVDAADMSAMADLVTGRIQGVPGVLRTITCVVAG
ncbi:MAG TPA: Lrp/AsnC family transcriptional regulator [Dehalococcoidia bacterium]|nr:Lrp/AsnC family transcriptional regulator [Dehalococcoidia bacterium]